MIKYNKEKKLIKKNIIFWILILNLLIRQKSALVKKTSFCVSKYAPVKKSYEKKYVEKM